ncbi:MAG: response regulator [Desulfobacteraceae bacterium]|nr:response regulator [Desulfobacteraceae bacterium]MCF8095460.1 response regulator [Desulfobacteraceae bacterium]
MDKVLIVDDDPNFLDQTGKGLEGVRQFEVLTAKDGEEAISILSDHRVSVLATDIETPSLDALELLAYMSQKHPNTPCIVTTDRGKPWFKKRISQQSFLYHLEKPFEIGSLVSAIFVGLNLRDEGTSAQGMTMASLLPLLELQQKTCRMQVRAADRRLGFLYFEEGELIDAHCGNLSVQDAAKEIASWNRISFSLSDLPRRRTRRRVKTKLMDFAEATWSTGEEQEEKSGQEGVELEEGVIELREVADDVEAAMESAYPGPEPSLEIRQKASGWLMTISEEVKDIRDCRLIAVITGMGRVLATQQKSGTQDVGKLALAMSGFMTSAGKAASRADMDLAASTTLHTKKGIVIMQQLENLDDDTVYAIVTCGPRSNWYFIKSRLEELSF